MSESVPQKELDLAALPETSVLYKLLSTCSLDHEVVMTTCNDGAIIFDCLECPFRRVLDQEEEAYILAQQPIEEEETEEQVVEQQL